MITLGNIEATYTTTRGKVKAVEGVSLDIPDSVILGIAGESGCGKSTLMKVIYGDTGFPLELSNGCVDYGFENAQGQPVTSQNIQKEWFRNISYIPQSSMSSLNPVVRIRNQFTDFPATSDKKRETLERARDTFKNWGCRLNQSIPTRTSSQEGCSSALWWPLPPFSSRGSSWRMNRLRLSMWLFRKIS